MAFKRLPFPLFLRKVQYEHTSLISDQLSYEQDHNLLYMNLNYMIQTYQWCFPLSIERKLHKWI